MKTEKPKSKAVKRKQKRVVENRVPVRVVDEDIFLNQYTNHQPNQWNIEVILHRNVFLMLHSLRRLYRDCYQLFAGEPFARERSYTLLSRDPRLSFFGKLDFSFGQLTFYYGSRVYRLTIGEYVETYDVETETYKTYREYVDLTKIGVEDPYVYRQDEPSEGYLVSRTSDSVLPWLAHTALNYGGDALDRSIIEENQDLTSTLFKYLDKNGSNDPDLLVDLFARVSEQNWSGPVERRAERLLDLLLEVFDDE